MKAFKFNSRFEDFEYPKDLEQIYNYLTSKGTLNISLITLDDLYRDFCDICYCASWMEIDTPILEHFADWLSDYEI